MHSITFIEYIYPLPLAEASLHFLIACNSVGQPPCDAKPGIELGPALQQADALSTEPRRPMGYAAPFNMRELNIIRIVIGWGFSRKV
jgi:hypothetical protein